MAATGLLDSEVKVRRILIVYNPCSSRYEDVKTEVISKIRDLHGYMVGKYEIEKTNFEDNVQKFSEVLKDGDIVVAAGGDATAAMTVNAILDSNKKVTLAVLPYGNFNDLAGTLGAEVDDVVRGATKNFYPLEIIVDGKLWRYATCYVTMGMTAEAVKIFDKPEMRRKLKTAFGRKIGSYLTLAGWYFRNRHKKKFLPEFTVNGVDVKKGASDYFAVNGTRVAGVMRGERNYVKPKTFRSTARKLTGVFGIFGFMIRSMFNRVPGEDTKGDLLEFATSGKVTMQAEGESQIFENVKTIEIRKSEKVLSVITK